jgi:pimeloyl-ACP methyl ester carboxylesterase
MRRQSLFRGLACLACLVVSGSSLLFAQNTSRAESLAAPDQFPIRFTYYPALKDKGTPQDAPVAILLHGAGGSRIVWDKGSAPQGGVSFPESLQNDGFAVLTVDLRKHGESIETGREEKLYPDDYQKMLVDLSTIKDFIKAEHQKKLLNMNKIGIVAADMSCPVAVAFAEGDWRIAPYDDAPVLANRTPRGQDVKALVLISPDASMGRLQLNKSITYLRQPDLNIACLFIVGKKDPADKGVTKKGFDLFKGTAKVEEGRERVYLSDPDLKDRGTDLLKKNPRLVEGVIKTFLIKHVKDQIAPWRERRSKLEL